MFPKLKLIKNFVKTEYAPGQLVCYTAVFSVVTQRTSPLTTGQQKVKLIRYTCKQFFTV